MTLRTAEVIQANMRKETGNDGYLMSNAKTYFQLTAKLKVDPLIMTNPLFSDYNGSFDTSSTDWCTYDIKNTRGY